MPPLRSNRSCPSTVPIRLQPAAMVQARPSSGEPVVANRFASPSCAPPRPPGPTARRPAAPVAAARIAAGAPAPSARYTGPLPHAPTTPGPPQTATKRLKTVRTAAPKSRASVSSHVSSPRRHGSDRRAPVASTGNHSHWTVSVPSASPGFLPANGNGTRPHVHQRGLHRYARPSPALQPGPPRGRAGCDAHPILHQLSGRTFRAACSMRRNRGRSRFPASAPFPVRTPCRTPHHPRPAGPARPHGLIADTHPRNGQWAQACLRCPTGATFPLGSSVPRRQPRGGKPLATRQTCSYLPYRRDLRGVEGWLLQRP